MEEIQRIRSALAAARFSEALKRVDPKHPWLDNIKNLPILKETKS